MIIALLIFAITVYVESTRKDCPVRNDRQAGCWYNGYFIIRGITMHLRRPCVRATCSNDGTTLQVNGCPFAGGSNPHPGAPFPAANAPYPLCCQKCSALPVGP
ncbi:hypothetical protein MRX96_023465 [Rhipicephalus microplus]